MKLIIIFILLMTMGLSASDNKMNYWKVQRKGANGSFENFSETWFKEAKEANLEYIRLNPLNFPPAGKHFLIGDSEDFKSLNQEDLNYLIKVLDAAHKYDIKIVLTMFELPGRVYFNIDERIKDNRLWKDKKFWDQSFELWKQLAKELKDHPAIVAYNPINEPAPAKNWGHEENNKAFREWLMESKGSAADLNLFNKKMLEAIRTVDMHTPVMLDGYFYCDPQGLPVMHTYNDPNILYPFHNPAPWQFAAYRANKGKYIYPDKMPEFWNSPGVKWDIEDLELTLRSVREFIDKNNIPSYQVIASEVWCDRRVEGCAEYFKDILSIYNREKWHWAFYAFRNDTAWTGLDFELGSEPMPGNYWYKIENENIDPETLKERKDNPIWHEIQNALK